MADWEKGYVTAQEQADFVILGNNSGIRDWDDKRARAWVLKTAKKFTVSYLDWMAPYAMLTMAKIAYEQGEWAAKVALLILEGAKPSDIPIVANRRWNMFVHPALLGKAGYVLPSELMKKAVKVNNE